MSDDFHTQRGLAAVEKPSSLLHVEEIDDEGEFRLLPPECVSRSEYEAARRGWKSELMLPAEDTQAAASLRPRQFSLSQLLLVMTLISIGLGGGSLLGPEVFAGVCGAGAFLSLLAANFQKQKPTRSFWFVSTVVYFIAATAAVIRHFCLE